MVLVDFLTVDRVFVSVEMLFVPTEHRNQCYGRAKSYGPGPFGSSPSKTFRQINCRTFQSGEGLLPRPNRTCSTTVTGCAPLFPSPAASSAKARSHQSVTSPANSVSVDNARSCPIPISSNGSQNDGCSSGFLQESRSLSNSELWAGPTYSNSPPPSSVPIPKFSLQQKRTVSLNLPASDPLVDVRPVAKSAPASPTRVHNSSVEELFRSVDSATKTLRRILNLDIATNEGQDRALP
ncbi:PREDICTED: uncharacterized protein LOC104801244 [Tarenaya hassleriana]|uniref:uncharacterized protein LOC104801244 n=1 Tax=Tarenaya hassleriana TaxID=28532 RepID=UPI00053C296C|nr:PREDICTED: uncharacterized protein LOC104801244 [Tarenaya hassleriana]XP_019056609.1 PREDICTED: uncharacterized protein LOC104801244 [Tarenaya hassleriana]